MKKIRVLHTEWSGGWGGQEMRILSEMLSVREHDIDVFLASTAHAKLTQAAQAHNIPCFHLPFKGNADLKTLWGLYKIIQQNSIDIINTHSGKDTWVGGLAAKMAGRCFIRTRHLSNPINTSRLNCINEFADHIITTGKSIRTQMIQNNRINPNKISSIPSGVDETLFDSTHYDRSNMRAQFKIAEDEIAIGIVAVLRRFKRHDLFIEMAHLLSQTFPKLRFFIAGEGPQRDAIVEKIKNTSLGDRIILSGHLSNPAELLSALDLFVLSSEGFEGVPQALIQALMMSCPAIATDAGSTADLWHEDNFTLIPQNDLPALMRAARSLIQDADLRARYAQKARPFVVQHFSQQKMTQQLLSLYNQLLKKGAP